MERKNSSIKLKFSNVEINIFKNEMKTIKEKIENSEKAIMHDLYFRNCISFLSKNNDDVEYYINKVKYTNNSPIKYSFKIVDLRNSNIPEFRFNSVEELINWMKNKYFVI